MDCAGRKSPILKPAMSWLQHSMLQQEVAAELKALASSTAALAFSWLPMPKQLTSVALLRLGGGPPFSLIIREVSSATHSAASSVAFSCMLLTDTSVA